MAGVVHNQRGVSSFQLDDFTITFPTKSSFTPYKRRYKISPKTTLEASFRLNPFTAMPHQSVMTRPSSLAATDSPGSHIRNYISTLVRRAEDKV
ncbi:hypothetical protein RYX36_014284 [Vicia faba]